MTNSNKIDKRKGAPLVLPANSPDLVFLNKNNENLILIGEGTTSGANVSPFGVGVGSGGGSDDGGVQDPIVGVDRPDLSDIESITYEQYFDTFNSIRYNAIIKIRNSSKFKDRVIGVDARNTPQGQVEDTGTTGTPNFVTPAPTVPSVIFDRTGTAIAWGWSQASGLGSYTSVTYEWEIRSGSSISSGLIDEGVKQFAESGSFPIGDSGSSRRYRVSSGDGDTPATASARWLRVRTVVVGTNGKTYYSNYSTPI